MRDSGSPYTLRVLFSVAFGVLAGMGAGKTVGSIAAPHTGYWVSLLINMLTAAAVAMLIAMPLLYCFPGRRPNPETPSEP